jgi:hypothetical protein
VRGRVDHRKSAGLSLACDPEIHGKHDVAKQHDVAFVGHVFPGPRAESLSLIRRKYPNSFVGQCYFEEMALTYSEARMVFNRSYGRRSSRIHQPAAVNARPDRLSSEGGGLEREHRAPPCFDLRRAHRQAGKPQEDAVMSQLGRAQAMVESVQGTIATATVS